MFDVGEPWRNAVLTGCFLAIAFLTIAAVVPWKSLGFVRLSALARWLLAPVLVLALYEAAMPIRFNIRVDLLLLLPMYAVIVVATIVRWIRERAA